MNVYDEGRILLIDKPYRWTSFDVVKKIRNLTRAKRVGHAGTLDPLATGLLMVCTGAFTKQISMIQDAEKEYTGTFFLGGQTASFDRETPVNQTFEISHLTPEMINEAVSLFIGPIMQIPPLYSAVKVKGERAYEMARRGSEHVLEAKPVVISVFEITGIELPLVHFRIVCSKGTYIRSLARDLGLALNIGAYLYDLCRTRIGNYHLKNAILVSSFMPET